MEQIWLADIKLKAVGDSLSTDDFNWNVSWFPGISSSCVWLGPSEYRYYHVIDTIWYVGVVINGLQKLLLRVKICKYGITEESGIQFDMQSRIDKKTSVITCHYYITHIDNKHCSVCINSEWAKLG